MEDFAPVAKPELENGPYLNIASIAERAGLKAKLKIPNKEGPYIVHIKQLHLPSNREEEVIACQKRIETFLFSLKKTHPDVTGVFLEGFSKEDISFFSQYVEDIDHNPNFAVSNPYSLDKLLNFYQSSIDNLTSSPQHDNRVLYVFDYILRKRIEFLRDHFQGNPRVSSGIIEDNAVRQATDILNTSVINGVNPHPYGEDTIYLVGAGMKMFLDKTINTVYPTSTEQLAKQTEAVFTKRNELIEQLLHANKRGVIKILSLTLRSIIAKINYHTTVYGVRENSAIRQIANLYSEHHVPIIPLVYGEAHDFSYRLSIHNFQVPDLSFGLIEVG